MAILPLRVKQLIGISSIYLVVSLAPLHSLALTVEGVPNPRKTSGGWVTDMAEVLKPETETQLNHLLTQLEAKNGSEMVVVTVPKTAPASSPKAFATELFNDWGIGKKGKDNGVLFLISVGDRRVEVETGYGVEAILPDAKVGTILRTEVTPRFKQGDFDGGTLSGTKALVLVLEGTHSQPGAVMSPGTTTTTSSKTVSQPQTPFWQIWITGGSVLLLSVLGLIGVRRPKLIEPEGSSEWEWDNAIRPLRCAHCQRPLVRLRPDELRNHLTTAQQTADSLGSTVFKGYRCPYCQPQTGGGVHIFAQGHLFSAFRPCPNCHTWTLKCQKIVLEEPTVDYCGRRLVVNDCLACNYHHETEESIPQLARIFSGSGDGGSGSGGGSGGSGGGGGSFGGGSSGGGGAGDSW